MRKMQLAAEGHGERQPPEHLRARMIETMTPRGHSNYGEVGNLGEFTRGAGDYISCLVGCYRPLVTVATDSGSQSSAIIVSAELASTPGPSSTLI